METQTVSWPQGQQTLRVIIAGGGTGGHIYPALAIAEALHAQHGADILYMGAEKGLSGRPAREKDLAEQAGWPYVGIRATGLSRRSPRIICDIIENYRGVMQARAKIKQYRPHIVIGTGGYAMAPVLRAAVGLKIPTLLHEQNAYPGWANRYLAKKVDMICLTFAEAKRHLPAATPTTLTGLPVRRAVIEANLEAAWDFFGIEGEERERPTLLLTGGSQGAKRLNEALVGCYGELLSAGLRIIHLTGEDHAESCRETAFKLPKQENLHILPYLIEMQHALALADLVVGRAGASFMAEIAVMGLPAILVPFPYAANDHQSQNAAAFVEAGAACLIKDADISASALRELTLTLIGDKTRLKTMAAAMRGLAKPQAIDNIVKAAVDLIKTGTF